MTRVGVEDGGAVIDLHVADRRHGLAVEIVDELVGLEEQLLFGRRLCGGRHGLVRRARTALCDVS